MSISTVENECCVVEVSCLLGGAAKAVLGQRTSVREAHKYAVHRRIYRSYAAYNLTCAASRKAMS